MIEEWLVDLLNWLTPRLCRAGRARRQDQAGWAIGEAVGGEGPGGRVALPQEELDRHLYLLGASGSGKSRLLELLIRQHLEQDEGFCLVDPHGDLTAGILAYLHERHDGATGALERLYLLEPFREDGVIGLNPLDPAGGPLHPHLGELVGIFRRFWASSWGPRMEEILRNTLVTLALAGLTLVEAIPLLTRAEFRARVLTTVQDEAVRGYWHSRFDPLSDAARLTVAEPVMNKLGALLADPRVRAMLGQREGCLQIRWLMDSGAWVLVNCSRGQLRDASYLLGSFLVAQLQSAALARAEVPEERRRRFTLFVDEFQHFRGEDFESILCEARKYRLRLVLAHQHLAQLDPRLQSAIAGNVATQVLFAVSPGDAAVAGRRMEGGTSLAQRLIHQPVGHALVCRRGLAPVSTRIQTVTTPEVEVGALARFAAALRANHGVPLSQAEAAIAARVSALEPRPEARVPLPPSKSSRKTAGKRSRPQPAASEGTIREASDD